MSQRARRVVFGLFVLLFGSLALSPIFFVDHADKSFGALGVLAEIAVLVVGIGIAVTRPPPSAAPVEAPAALGAVSPYRGAAPPAAVPFITKASAKRLTIGILAALAFTATAVPFAVHLPRWIEAELVVGVWWLLLGSVLAAVAYRGSKVEDDHRSSPGSAVDLSGASSLAKASWGLDAAPDIEGCLVAIVVMAVVAIALFGAWLVVELVAPAVFIVAYRGVVRALAKAQAANTRGNAVRSAISGMGWAAVGTAPLAAVVVLVHALFAG